MIEYNTFGKRIKTAGGDSIAVVGICLLDNCEICTQVADKLKYISFNTCDPTELDMILAESLNSLYSDISLVVGASVYIPDISEQVFRSGGVLGRPGTQIESAESDLEELIPGMWMYTASGGPGWVAICQQAAAENLVEMTISQTDIYALKVNSIYRRLINISKEGYLFISDGTGYDSFGICASMLGNKEYAFIV